MRRRSRPPAPPARRPPTPRAARRSRRPFEVLEHTADVGFLARGASLPGLFESAALALLHVAAARARPRRLERRPLRVEGDDVPSLLVNFLAEILSLFDAGHFAPARVEVARVTPTAVEATLVGEPRSPARHRWSLIVKAVTYHGLEVREHDGAWTARVFLDI